MRFIVLSMFVGLTGCDLNEGPAEERREANEAILEGERPGEVRDELQDINGRRGDVVVGDDDFDRDLRHAETWAEKQRRGIDEGTREANAEFDQALNEIQRDLKKIRQDVANLGDGERNTVGDDLKQQLKALSLKIDKLDGEVDDKPGKDPMGPG